MIFTGMGGSLFATLAAVSRLTQEGYPVQAMESAELLHYGSASLRAADVGVVISRSGGSIEPVLLAEKMREAGMTVIAVTNVPGSTLEKIADITLPIGSQADKLIAVQTYTGTVLTLLLLAEEVLAGESARLSDACGAALPALSRHIDECLRASDGWQEWLMGGPLYLLGRGPALGSVYEGALLLHETAKAAAVGMSSGQFRHGPAEILSGDFRAVVFGAPPATQALDRSLADDLFSVGAKVRWIGAWSRSAHPHWFRGRRFRLCSRRCLKSFPCRWRLTGSRCGAASLPATFVSSPRSRPQSRVFLLPNNLHWRITDEITHTP